MNMLYLLDEPLTRLDCATFRASAIETYDTAFLKDFTASGAEVYAAVSHAVDPDCVQNPIFHYEYEKPTLTFGGKGITGSHFVARFADGSVKDYGVVELSGQQLLWNMIDAIRGEDEIACPGETAMLHVDTIEKCAACSRMPRPSRRAGKRKSVASPAYRAWRRPCTSAMTLGRCRGGTWQRRGWRNPDADGRRTKRR